MSGIESESRTEEKGAVISRFTRGLSGFSRGWRAGEQADNSENVVTAWYDTVSWIKAPPWTINVATALVVFMATLVWAVDPSLQRRGLVHDIPVEVVCTVAASLVFLLRRACPLACALAGVGLMLVTGCPYAVVLGAFWVGRKLRRGLWWGIGIALLNLLAFSLAYPHSGFSWQMYDGILSPFLPALVGWSARQEAVVKLLLSERLKCAERHAEAAARESVRQERERLAEELHDTISFRLNTVAMYAGIIESRKDPGNPDRDHSALIRESAVSAVRELQVLLGYLKEDEGEGDSRKGLNRYLSASPKLVREAIAAGLHVEMTVSGDWPLLPRETDLAAYRLVQEGLTNALKYASGAKVDVVIEHQVGAMTVAVVNTAPQGTGGHQSGSGLGLKAMQRRVEKAKGEFKAGPTAEGGFAVRASLPLPTVAAQ
ncbi:sensor histidine kinase [Streptomyces sp. NPDC002537]